MKKKQIQEAYKIANRYVSDNPDNFELECLVQIGLQMALSGEVLFDKEDKIIRIE
jgi:hypothetical protein